MSAWVKALTVIVVTLLNGSAANIMSCGLGQRVVQTSGDVSNYCGDCPSETYMDKAEHTDVTCKSCSKIVNHDTEFIERNCTRFMDRLIRCKLGHFRVNKTQIPEVDMCKRCAQCKLGLQQAHPCHDYDDTLCCHDSQVASLDPATNKFKCYDNFCGQNQYYERYSGFCYTCPPLTFQPSKRHRESICVPLHSLNYSLLCGENCSSSGEVNSTKGMNEDNTQNITSTLMSTDVYSTDVSTNGTNNSIQENTTKENEFHYDDRFVVCMLLMIYLILFLSFVMSLWCSHKSCRAQNHTNTKVCEHLRQAPKLYAIFYNFIILYIFYIIMNVLFFLLSLLLFFSLHKCSIGVLVLIILLQIVFMLLTFWVMPAQRLASEMVLRSETLLVPIQNMQILPAQSFIHSLNCLN